ncbi:hypothetical protein BD769DRAFT_118985 [Suillus cothurnatus]|nr:hypothetical protein BD769DRAFT_118985 [Suillus cothurnatus]
MYSRRTIYPLCNRELSYADRLLLPIILLSTRLYQARAIDIGFIESFTGVMNLTIIASFSCGMVIFGMIGLSTLASVVVLGVLYGYFAGLNVAMAGPLVANLTPDISEFGARMGICFCIMAFGGLIGTPISGALLTSHYTWWIPGLFSGIVSLAGGMVFLIMRHMFLKRQRVDVLPLDSQVLTPE